MRQRLGYAVYAWLYSQSVVALLLYIFCDYESEVKNQLLFLLSVTKERNDVATPRKLRIDSS